MPHGLFGIVVYQLVPRLRLELTTDGTTEERACVDISGESAGVCLDLGKREASTLVETSRAVVEAGNERSLKAAEGSPLVLVTHRVWEGDTGGTELALGGLVDVGGGGSRALVLAGNTDEGDVVADDFLLAVDAKVVVSDGALLAWDGSTVGDDDLVRGRFGVEGRGEVEREGAEGVCLRVVVLVSLVLAIVVLLAVVHGSGDGRSDKASESEG